MRDVVLTCEDPGFRIVALEPPAVGGVETTVLEGPVGGRAVLQVRVPPQGPGRRGLFEPAGGEASHEWLDARVEPAADGYDVVVATEGAEGAGRVSARLVLTTNLEEEERVTLPVMGRVE